MVGTAVRSLWAEPRPAHPPARVWRDWALLAVLVAWSVLEALLRDERGSRLLVLAVSLVIAGSLLWRRTQPLMAVAVAFGTVIAFDVARIVAIEATGLLSFAALLLLPYALTRWGSGRESAIGLGVILAWLAITHVADPTDIDEVIAGYGFFLFSAALGASVRFHAYTRARDIEQVKLRERNKLARELHDTVGHHVSAIAIQAQAGRALAASQPDRALTVLATIEDTASRTLAEMRAMVGVLREDAAPGLIPQPGVRDIEQLAGSVSGPPRIDVRRSGDLADVHPAIGTALYRITQEAVTNGLRHADDATVISVHVADEGERVRLTIHDDGMTSDFGHRPGYGLIGMDERASLLGGTLRAGPDPDGGWTVDVVLPKRSPA